MKRRIIIFAIMIGTTFLWLPPAGYSASTEIRSTYSKQNGVQWQERRDDRRRKQSRKNYRGYRNYGQYRRNQVGNRRYQMSRQYYWLNGTRRSRNVWVNY